MTKMYVLEQVGFGVIAYSENFEKIKEYYNKETDNGKFAGFTVCEVDCNVDLNKIGEIQLFTYLTLCARSENATKIEMGKYTVRYSERESGWVEIASFNSLKDAKEEFNNQLDFDKNANTTDVRTEIIDIEGNVLQFYEGENY